MKYFKIFLAIIVLIILLLFVFLTNKKNNTKETFQGDGNLIMFNLIDIINSDDQFHNIADCNLVDFRYPPLANDQDYANNVKYIYDSNFIYTKDIKGFYI